MKASGRRPLAVQTAPGRSHAGAPGTRSMVPHAPHLQREAGGAGALPTAAPHQAGLKALLQRQPSNQAVARWIGARQPEQPMQSAGGTRPTVQRMAASPTVAVQRDEAPAPTADPSDPVPAITKALERGGTSGFGEAFRSLAAMPVGTLMPTLAGLHDRVEVLTQRCALFAPPLAHDRLLVALNAEKHRATMPRAKFEVDYKDRLQKLPPDQRQAIVDAFPKVEPPPPAPKTTPASDEQLKKVSDVATNPTNTNAAAPSSTAAGDTRSTLGNVSRTGAALQDLTKSQFELGLSQGDAEAFCGPTAALAFLNWAGRNPTVAEAKALAQKVGWTAAAGMAGPASQVRLIKELGGNARMESPVDWEKIKGEVNAGRPVIIDTPGHYFVVTGFDAANGKFDFGKSATSLRAAGHKRYFTPEQLAGLGMGAARSAIFIEGPDDLLKMNLPADQAGATAQAEAPARGSGAAPAPAGATLASDQQIPTSGLSGTEKTMAEIFNTKGRYLKEKAAELGIKVADVAAVLKVESGGGGEEGARMTIRFEPGLLWDSWGERHPDVFSAHLNSSDWRANHAFRRSPGEPFRPFHGNQDLEWEVLEFMRTKAGDAAITSISMGAGQVLGSNYKMVGYSSPSEMLDRLKSGLRPQLDAMFAYIVAVPKCINGLRNGDFASFAAGYNGPGQVGFYAGLLQDASSAFTRVVGNRV